MKTQPVLLVTFSDQPGCPGHSDDERPRKKTESRAGRTRPVRVRLKGVAGGKLRLLAILGGTTLPGLLMTCASRSAHPRRDKGRSQMPQNSTWRRPENLVWIESLQRKLLTLCTWVDSLSLKPQISNLDQSHASQQPTQPPRRPISSPKSPSRSTPSVGLGIPV